MTQPYLPQVLSAKRKEHFSLKHGGFLDLHRGFVQDHRSLLETLQATLPLCQEELRMFGRMVKTPRLTSWHGDPSCSYRYSGRTFTPKPWTQVLLTLRDRIHHETGVLFNSVLANLYRDQRDAMGAHSDDEPELGPHRDDVRIASLSLGERRRFVVSPKDKQHAPLKLALGEGDLLVMGGTTQRHYRHALPRVAKPTGPRLNLTFRVVLDATQLRDRGGV